MAKKELATCWCKKFSTRANTATGIDCECFIGTSDKPLLIKNIILFKRRK